MIPKRHVPHDLLFQRAPSDQPVHINDLLLTNTMRSIHGLGILHRIPVVVHEDYRVRSRQSQPKTANTGGQEQDINTGIVVERLHNIMPTHGLGRSVKAHIAHAGHQLGEKLCLDDVQHILGLRKYENTMIGCGASVVTSISSSPADTAVQKELSSSV